jgi:phosphoribosylaminoimidazolecarboxamide formyltransferase/IMP cyclohydrolase
MKMVSGDPLALFGGLVMVNFPIDMEEVVILQNAETERKILFDVVVALGFSPSAIEALKRKKGKCRLLENSALSLADIDDLDKGDIVRSVRGGFLIQENYGFILDLKDERLIKYGELEHTAEDDMLLAKAICDTSNSNTITIVKNGMLLGNGVGQTARVHGAAVALYLANKAGHTAAGAVAASDSFFIHTDAPELLHEAGITGIISTSGSVKDKEVIQYCQDKGIILYLIPDAIGRGFCNH